MLRLTARSRAGGSRGARLESAHETLATIPEPSLRAYRHSPPTLTPRSRPRLARLVPCALDETNAVERARNTLPSNRKSFFFDAGSRLPRARAPLPHAPDARVAMRALLQVPAGARASAGPPRADPPDPAPEPRVQDRDEDRALHRFVAPRRDEPGPRDHAASRAPQLRPQHRVRPPGARAQVRARQRGRRHPTRRRAQVPREQAEHLQPGGHRRAERDWRTHRADGQRAGRRRVRRPGARPAPSSTRRGGGHVPGPGRRPRDREQDSGDSRAEGKRRVARGLRRGEALARRHQPPQGGGREGCTARAPQAQRYRGGGLRRREGDQERNRQAARSGRGGGARRERRRGERRRRRCARGHLQPRAHEREPRTRTGGTEGDSSAVTLRDVQRVRPRGGRGGVPARDPSARAVGVGVRRVPRDGAEHAGARRSYSK